MAFWIGVAQDVVANLLTAAIVAVVVTLAVAVGFSASPRRLWRRLFPRRPDHRVLVAKTAPAVGATPKFRNRTPFKCPVSPHEQEALVRFYALMNGSDPFDGRCVRLDRLAPEAEVSEVGFFDLLATNLTAYPDNIATPGLWLRFSAVRQWISLVPVLQQVRQAAKTGGDRPRSVEEALANPHMANVAAVSVLVMDSNRKAAIVQRQSRLAVSSGQFGTTAAGTVSDKDLSAGDPFLGAARRELYEETGIEPESLEFEALVLPVQKMQPIFLYTAYITKPWQAMASLLEQATDFHRETAHMFLLGMDDPKAIASFLATARITDAAAYHIWLAAKRAAGEHALVSAWRSVRPWSVFLRTERYLDLLSPKSN